MQVVMVAGKSQIAWGIGAAVLLSNDVFDVKDEEGIVLFVNSAVFAALPCTLPDQFPCWLVHYEGLVSRARALA